MQWSGAGISFLFHPGGTLRVPTQTGKSVNTSEILGCRGTGRKEKSTFKSLHFFCDFGLVLLLSCHCIGCLFLIFADLQLLLCVSL